MEILNTLFNFSSVQFQSFVLIALRFSGLFVAAPVLSNHNIPGMVKIGMILFSSAVIFPFVPQMAGAAATNLEFFALLAKEFAVGLVMGFFLTLVFVALQLAGQFIDYQTGFGLVNIIDPESNVQVPLMGQFLYILAMLLFLIIRGHHWMIQSLVQSFDVLPLGFFKVNDNLMMFVNTAFAKTLVLSFKIAAPVVAAIFLSEMAYGVMARAIPQMNMMIVGLPLKMGLGIFMVMLILPLFFWVMKREFFNIFISVRNLFEMI